MNAHTPMDGLQPPATLPPSAWSNLPAMVADVAGQHADRTAFTCVMPNGMNGSLSYAEVQAHSDAFAHYLRAVCKLRAGDRVALQLPNSLAYPVALLGVLKAGCVAVNTNPLYTSAEMAHQFKDSGAQALVIVDLFADKLEAILAQTDIRHVVIARLPEFFPSLVGGIVQAVLRHWHRQVPRHALKAVTLADALAQGRAAAPGPAENYSQGLGPDSLALLQYTGGTTGVAKGAMLTHGNLLANLEQMLAMARSRIEPGREVVLTALPLYHIFAFTVNFLVMFRMGAHNVLVPNPRPVQNLQRAFENYPITWVTGVNTLYNALLSEEWFTAFPPRHLKAAGGGGAAMHAAVVARWEKLTGTPLIEGYGLTEASPVVSFQPLDAPRRPDTIGLPAPGTEVRLADDDGHPVAPGEPGELLLRGPQVMQGYWKRPEATAEVLKDGWLRTGDVAVRDPDGVLRIVDRKKDLVLVSGFNVYPNEVEAVLAEHPGVQEAAVIGVPDARSGEAVRAYVVRRDPALSIDDLRTHCAAHLTGYKRPVHYEFREELPKTPVGKILRKNLRAEVLSARQEA